MMVVLLPGAEKMEHVTHRKCWYFKVEIFLEQREVAFLSPSKICENLNLSTVHL